MPIRAELRTYRGEVIRGLDDPAGGTCDGAGGFDALLPHASTVPPPPPVETYRLLRYVDPDGATIFNTLQMDDLLSDIEIATELAVTPIQRRGLDRLRVVAQRCKDSGDLYVWFVGD